MKIKKKLYHSFLYSNADLAKHAYKCPHAPSDPDERFEKLKECFVDTRYNLTLYQCRYCQECGEADVWKHVNKDQVKKHEKSHFPEEAKKICQFCSKRVSAREDNLQRHERWCKKNPAVIERRIAANSHLPLNE